MAISALLAFFLSAAQADTIRVSVEGMVCVSCEVKIKEGLKNVDYLDNLTVSASAKMMCADVTGPFDEAAFTALITDIGYTITALDRAPECAMDERKYPLNWVEKEGLNAEIISRGEAVDLPAHRAQGKFTVYDFGAPWCGPCHVAEKMLKDYMRDNADVAVRAIVLDSDNAKNSFAMPAAQQHLVSAPGLPYFLVVAPNGRTVYRGSDVARALKKMDAKR